MRVGVLLAADVAVIAILQLILLLTRSGAALGERVGTLVASVVPAAGNARWEVIAAVVLGLAIFGNYRRGDHRHHARGILYGTLLGIGLVAWTPMWATASLLLGLGFVMRAIVIATALIVARAAIDRTVRVIRAGSHAHASRTLIVGSSASARALLRSDPFSRHYDLHVLGYLTVDPNVGADALGGVSALPTVLNDYDVETVIVAGPLQPEDFVAVVDLARSAGCEVASLPAGYLESVAHPKIIRRDGVPFIEISRPGLDVYQVALKRAADIVLAATALLLLAPLFLLVSLAIVLDSPGGAFFAQERVGYGARRFRMLKFRTMRAGADAEKQQLAHLNASGDARLFKIPDDPRITRLGAWLRRWSLDELPQLINVLRGDMSLVGPRPFFESDLAHYETHHFHRLAAKPGITGLWQVEGRSSIRDFEEVVRLDRDYIRRWSLLLDLSILVRTLPAVVRRTGAC